MATNIGVAGSVDNGTYNNFPTRGLPGPFTGSPGLGVDGSSQSVTVPADPSINGAAFSVEVWANPGQVPKFGYLAASAHLAAPRQGWYLAQDDGSTFGLGSAFVVRMFNTNSTTPSVTLSVPVNQPVGTWYHVVLTFDGTTATMYENGVAVTNASPTMNAAGLRFIPNTDAQFSVGIRSDNGFPWPGKVAEVAVYNTALSGIRVAAHYAAATSAAAYTTAVGLDSPQLYWRFTEQQDPVAANLGTLGSANNALYFYDAKVGVPGPSTPKYPGFASGNNAVAFDAAGGTVSIPALNLNTNAVTITGWINATGSQATATGLVICNSGTTLSGLTIDQEFGGLGIGYIWNGNNYGLSPSSDLGLPTLPDSDWAYVALVVQPNQAALYVCASNNVAGFAGVTNPAPHAIQAFAGATLIGTEAGFPLRSLNGAMDEVAIWNRALGEGELYSQYGAAVGGVAPKIFTDLQGPALPVAAGDPIVLSIDAGGTPDLVYTWHRAGTNYATTTNLGTLTIPTAALTDSGTYDVTITGVGSPAQSQSVSVTVITPTQPVITGSQGMLSRKIYPKATLHLSVTATGGGLKYQWYKNGTGIGSATTSSYNIASVTNSDAGAYSVIVTNGVGKATNGPITITIPTVTNGTYVALMVAAAPEAWWRLDEPVGSTNMFDGMGRHDGYYTNVNGTIPPVALGAVGVIQNESNTCASFSASGGVGVAPYSGALNPNQFSVETWVNTSVINNDTLAPISSVDTNGGGYWVNTIGGYWFGDSTAGYFGNNGNVNTAAAITPGQWSHVVITYDGTRTSGGTHYPFILYVNGQTDGYIWGAPPLNGSGPFMIGGRGPSTTTATAFADRFFNGQVDEVAVYGRLLTVAEIQSHFNYHTNPPTPPFFVKAFIPQSVTTGKSVSFATTLLGTTPMSLQWYKDGTLLASQTNNTLSITNTAVKDSGNYTLWATNVAGTVSQSVSMTVIPPVSYANVTNGLVLHMRFEGDSTDSSGRGNNGTAGGAPVGPPSFVTGLIGSQALQYLTQTTNGSGSTVTNANWVDLGTVGSGPPSDLRFGAATSFTIGLWVKTSIGNIDGDLPYIGTATNSNNNPGWDLSPSYQTGGWQWALNDGSVNFNLSGPANSINDGAWHNFVLVVDRTAHRANTYFDGVAAAITDITTLGSIDNNNYWPITIGQDPTHLYSEPGSSTLDDIGIWRRALTPLEVAKIQSAGSSSTHGSFDTVAPPITITATISGGVVTLHWAGGTLTAADSLNPGSVFEPVSGASAPSYVVPSGGTKKFYRIFVQ
jgi:hypothetical protein